ncbi:uncharacterized protein PHACADRAFT_27231 [Phanerochaete carnosa HHB-10118-sp]|uniref:Uncharacterized protein n=1 Tax=Phanerochaete carnosa (strain HHB-10118-sp) TaxID=650164 RepID=K5X0R7_PHACS|nr:uncharacterized protein PHACADRAFT_27231 [Phanerochaete carnosa HHB-10118-sp]EKM56337.1 hypothetical protein PHACADRAFT_27231 [Phanerochaete carnosa HHB-10118-sp]
MCDAKLNEPAADDDAGAADATAAVDGADALAALIVAEHGKAAEHGKDAAHEVDTLGQAAVADRQVVVHDLAQVDVEQRAARCRKRSCGSVRSMKVRTLVARSVSSKTGVCLWGACGDDGLGRRAWVGEIDEGAHAGGKECVEQDIAAAYIGSTSACGGVSGIGDSEGDIEWPESKGDAFLCDRWWLRGVACAVWWWVRRTKHAGTTMDGGGHALH